MFNKINKKFLIIGLGVAASVAIVATPLAIVSKFTYQGDSIKNVQDALNMIANVSFQQGEKQGQINKKTTYQSLKSFYFDSENQKNDKAVVSNFDFFEKDKSANQFTKIDKESFGGNFEIVVDDLKANDKSQNFTIFYYVQSTKENEFGKKLKSEVKQAELNFGVKPEFLLATEAHSKVGEFEQAIKNNDSDLSLNPYTIQDFKTRVEAGNTFIRPLALVTKSDFVNDINRASSLKEVLQLLDRYFNFSSVFNRIFKKGDYQFSLIKNPNLSQKPGEGQYITQVNDAGKTLFRLYLKTELSSTYKAEHSYLPELDAAHIDTIDFDLSSDKFKDLFLKSNFTSDWTVNTPTKKTDYYTSTPDIDAASSKSSKVAAVVQHTVTAVADTSTTDESNKSKKVDSSKINVFDFLSQIDSSFFSTKEEQNQFVTSYINSMLKNNLTPTYNGQDAGIKLLNEKEKALLFNYYVQVDADSLTLTYDEKENKPVIEGKLIYSVASKSTNIEKEDKSLNPQQFSTISFKLDNFKDFDSTVTKGPENKEIAYPYKDIKAPQSFEDFLFDNEDIDNLVFDNGENKKILLSEFRKAYLSNDNQTIYKLLSDPNYYGLVLNSAKNLDALTKEFQLPSLESIPYTFKNATSNTNIQNGILNIDSNIFKNNIDVLRFYFALEKQGFTKVAQYLFDILKSTGNIPQDSQLNINQPVFEQLSKIRLIKAGENGFNTFSFANSYQLNKDNAQAASTVAPSSKEVDAFDDFLDKPKPGASTQSSNDNSSIDFSSLSAFDISSNISQQIQQGTITSDSEILKSVNSWSSDQNESKFKSVADVLLAFYTKLHNFISDESLPLTKINGNLGYKVEFKLEDNSNINKLASFDQSNNDISSLKIQYRYFIGFVDPKNPNSIQHGLFKTEWKSLGKDIEVTNDVQTPSTSLTPKLEEKIKSIPEYYKTFYLSKEKYADLGGNIAVKYSYKKDTPTMTIEDLWQSLDAPQVANYYKNTFGKDAKFWVFRAFADSTSAPKTKEHELPKASDTPVTYTHTIDEALAKKAGLTTTQPAKGIELTTTQEQLIEESKKGESNGGDSNRFKQNYKEIRLFVQSGKEISKTPLILKVYEQN